MICSFNRLPRGLTLIEILVSSALFGLFTGMVATALVMANRTEDRSVQRLDAIRRASVALDLMVRDVQAAKFFSDITMNGALPPATPTQPVGVNELQVKRWYPFPGYPDSVQPIVVGYWYDQGTGEVGEGMVRRVLYDGWSMTTFPNEPEDGRILVRDVIDFQVSTYLKSGLTFLKAEIWVVGVGRDTQGRPVKTNPITTSVVMEPTTAP